MSRKIIVANSLDWLSTQKDGSIPNVITGICDLDEIEHLAERGMNEYIEFFNKIGALIFQKLNPAGYAIFIQTDRKYQREWIDKSYMLTDLAYKHGYKMVWHKIVLHRDVDKTDLHRPCYAHMLCYTKTGTSGAATPDVIPVSDRLYKNGTPIEAAVRAVEFVKRYTKAGPFVLDPFVGQGTIPAIANAFGLNAVGIDIDAAQAAKAEKMEYRA